MGLPTVLLKSPDCYILEIGQIPEKCATATKIRCDKRAIKKDALPLISLVSLCIIQNILLRIITNKKEVENFKLRLHHVDGSLYNLRE